MQDVITKINGKPIRFENDLEVLGFLGSIRPGQALALSVTRLSSAKVITLMAIEMPDRHYDRWLLNFELAEHGKQKHKATRLPD